MIRFNQIKENEKAVRIIFGIVGAASASTVTFFVTRSAYSKKYKAIADEEIASLKKVYRGEIKRLEKELEETSEENFSDLVSELKAEKEKFAKLMAEVDYNEEELTEEEHLAEAMEHLDAMSLQARKDDGLPYISSPGGHEEVNGYEKHTLLWYPQDEILCDEEMVVIPDIDGVIGEDHVYGDVKVTDVIYVRNDELSSDFEIIVKEGSYIDDFGSA